MGETKGHWTLNEFNSAVVFEGKQIYDFVQGKKTRNYWTPAEH